ncbi:iron chelate uptake ABC transporter family permease subunit [soil metagenome]
MTALTSGTWVVRSERLGISFRTDLRAVSVTLVLLAATAVVFAWSISVGDFSIPIREVVETLLGGGSGGSTFIVRELRLPRAAMAVTVGAAFGVAGAIFQRVADNPLASPDVIGIDSGAAVVAVAMIVWWNGTASQISIGALLGSFATAFAIYVLAWKSGVSGYRLVLVGIAIAAMLRAVTSYLLTRAEISDAAQAAVWLVGSLNGRSWSDLRPVALGVVILAPIAVAMSRQLRLLELGEDTARGLGTRVGLTQGMLMLVGVLLAALATSAAGPIAFVALVSPQIAKRLTGVRTVGLLPAAAMGALLLLTSDLLARRLFAPTELPVGIITGVLGAPFLLYLLARGNRIGRG